MNFRKRGDVVIAYELTSCIHAPDGETLAACGDWIVCQQNGERLIVAGEVFKRDYAPLAGPNPFLTNQQPPKP